jgi:hypothetical protein
VEERPIELIDYLVVLWRWKWLIALGTAACLLVAGVVVWRIPKTYVVGATVDAGDLSDERAKDVERVVSRLNTAGRFDLAGNPTHAGPVALTAEYRKPFAVVLRSETETPAAAVQAMERVAARLVADLGQMLKAQREEEDGKLAAIRRRTEAVHREADSALAQLRADVEHRARALRDRIAAARAEIQRARQARDLLQRRADTLRRSLEDLGRARADAAGTASDPARVLVFTQLSNEIVAKENELTSLEQELSQQVPAQLQSLESNERGFEEQLRGLETARTALAGREGRRTGRPEIGAMRGAVYRAALSGALELNVVELTLRRLEIDLPEQIRTLEQQAELLARRSATLRPPQLVAAPVVPTTPVRPRVRLTLAASAAAGLVGACLLAFVVEYVEQATARRARAAGQVSRPGEERPA